MLSSLTVNNHILGWSWAFAPNSFWKSEFFSFFQLLSKALSSEKSAWEQRSDDQCVRKISSHGEAPFLTLFERYGDLVFGYCHKILKDKQLAEDVSQEVWVKVISNASKYHSKGKFKAWLMQIARNTCFSLLRSRNKTFIGLDEESDVEDVLQKDILDLISGEEDKAKIKACLLKLPDPQRVAIVVWMTEDKSYEEIAEEMKTSVSSVKSLLFRGKQNLKTMLSES